MDNSYQAIEARIKDGIQAYHAQKKPNLSAIAREFSVPIDRIKSRLNGTPSKSEVRGVHNRLLTPEQDVALTQYFHRLVNNGAPPRLNQIKSEAIRLLRLDWDPAKPFPEIGPQWAKRWLDRQPELFKTRRKPLAAERKNAHDLDLITGHFERFRKVVQENDIHPEDMWNFDETGYRIGMARGDWIIAIDPTRTVYSKCPNNRELVSAIECINGGGRDIPPFLILTGTNILAPWFVNDLHSNIAVTTSETGFNNDWISLQWIKHFETFSRRGQRGKWRLLIMDGFGSHDTFEFLEYCEYHNIIPFTFPSHTTHLLQPLDVCIFQPLKHWHAEAVNQAISTGDESFSKVEFLAAFNTFRTKAFKPKTIISSWKHTGMIPYNPEIVLQKVRDSLPPPRATTPESQPFIPLAETPKTIRQLSESGFELFAYPDIPEQLRESLIKFTRGSIRIGRCGLLMEQRLEATLKAENARKARKSEASKVLQKGGVLYSGNARHMNRERLELEEARDRERTAASQKRYDSACSKVYKTANKVKKAWRKEHHWNIRIYKEVLVELNAWIEESVIVIE